MSPADPLDACYRKTDEYQPRHDGNLWLLEDAEGWGLACDEWAYRTWAGFDGRPTQEVVSSVSSETGASAAVLESIAKVLARAGMLIPSQPLPPLPKAPASDISDLAPFPLVSLIILASRQARGHLETCLPSVRNQTYPNLEIILADNQTTDDSAEFTRQHFPEVRILSIPGRKGFGGANNYAMKQARGEFFLMINEDTEMDPDCVAECVRVMLRSDQIAAVAPKMKLFYMRDFINSMGNSTHPNGQSHDNFIGYLDVGQFDDKDEVFTACFGAAMVRREAIEKIGYMDEKYFVYYDDVDWSYRARIYGYGVVTAPRAIIYHKFNATVSTLASTFKLGLIVHNRLRFAWRNFDFRRARQFLWMYLGEDVGNFFWALSKKQYDVARTYAKARLQWLLSWPEATYRRWQTRRACHPDFSDDAAFALIDQVPTPSMYGRYPAILVSFVRAHYMQLERFKPESPPAAEDLVPALGPMTAPSSHLAEKAWQTLKTRGMSGLVKETQNYLRWRFGSL